MKKLIIALILLVLTVGLTVSTAAEISMPAYYIHELDYDGNVLSGHAVVPQDGRDYYLRVTIFGDAFFVALVIPIKPTGDFILPIAVPWIMCRVCIIDQYSVAPPITVYAWGESWADALEEFAGGE